MDEADDDGGEYSDNNSSSEDDDSDEVKKQKPNKERNETFVDETSSSSTFSYSQSKHKPIPVLPSRNLLIGFISLASRNLRSWLQPCDIIRWIQNGFTSYNCLLKTMPPEIKISRYCKYVFNIPGDGNDWQDLTSFNPALPSTDWFVGAPGGAHVWGSEESLEGMNAFLEKRKPDFQQFRERRKENVEAYLDGLDNDENERPN